MKKLLSLATLLATSSLFGCASTSTAPVTYMDNYSEAYNLAKAGGLYNAEDFDIPKSQRDGIISKSWDVADDALLFNSQYGLGLDWSDSIGLGILTNALAPKGVMERDSVFAWVPETQVADAKEAWELMSETLLSGIEGSLQQANLEYVVDNRNLVQDIPLVAEYIFSSVRIVAPEHGCLDWEQANHEIKNSCYVQTIVYAPTNTPRKIPEFVVPGQSGYAFYAEDETEYSRFKVNIPEGATLEKNLLLAAISRELPPWAFIFIASEKQDNGSYSAPAILTKGKAELFITPDKG